MPDSNRTVTIVGGGLAGSEAALQLAERGVRVKLYEMRPVKSSPAHRTGDFAELVCSNSLKSLDGSAAAGVLKYELATLGSCLFEEAINCQVPAGKALAVDRNLFSEAVSRRIESNPNIEIVYEEVSSIPEAPAIIATGPLTSDAMAANIAQVLGDDFMAFYDAAAPIVEADSINRDKVFAQSRYGKGGTDDYLNAPFDKEQYERFIDELLAAEKVIPRDFEGRDLFNACQPVEEIARNGRDALRFGPLKPVGLIDPSTGKRPWAVVQLRAENEALTAYNLVGFQTNLKHPDQQRVFRMIPGLENAVFARYGVMHRNTFIDSPKVLTPTFGIPGLPGVRFAGQITGTEGYCEAMASGLLSALATFAELEGMELPTIPEETVFGSLVKYATSPQTQDYQPMHVNYGIAMPLPMRIKHKQQRYLAYAKRAREAIESYRAKLEAEGMYEGLPQMDIPQTVMQYVEPGLE